MIVKITPLSVKLELPLDSVSNCSVDVWALVFREKTESTTNKIKVKLFFISRLFIKYIFRQKYIA
jgi:hypothetical protein